MTERNDGSNQRPEQDYEVGYGRPPKERRFKAGQSGNPKGRKRKPKSVKAQMQNVVSRRISITEGGKTKRVPLQEVILRNLANKAAKGDLKAIAFVLNLLNSPEYADTDTIDQNSLSPDDQAMFDELVRQLGGANWSDETSHSGIVLEEDAENGASAETTECRRNSGVAAEEDDDDD